MPLDQLLSGVEVRARSGDLPGEVGGLHYDSRRIRAGQAFVAIEGETTDGNRFVPQALAQGASLIVSERSAPPTDRVGWIQVAQARRALARMAANWFGQPAEKLPLVGITGTNGKTTTAFLCESILATAGLRPGLLGTIEYHVGGEVRPSPHTTPESYDLQELLAAMAAGDDRSAVLEVSSHALAMDRTWGCPFAVAVFTNLTQDHLDYHHTLEAYRLAKKRLFDGTGAGQPQHAVVNRDDPSGAAMIRDYRGATITYGFSEPAQLRATQLEASPAGTRFQVQGPEGLRMMVRSPLLAQVNVLNALAAIGVGLAFGVEAGQIQQGIESVPRVPGRFERIDMGQPFTVVVDYAHTPDALANVLRLARELAAGGRVITAFGCGGDRDRGKRPLMGELAGRLSDRVVVTSDNPRSEDPRLIINDILVGLQRTPAVAVVEPDRRAAIRWAVREARRGDVVVLAGKGHETYQIVGDQRTHFDDGEEARAALRDVGACN